MTDSSLLNASCSFKLRLSASLLFHASYRNFLAIFHVHDLDHLLSILASSVTGLAPSSLLFSCFLASLLHFLPQEEAVDELIQF